MKTINSIEINSELNLSANLRLNNRVVIPAMASGTATEFGYVTDRTIAHYKALSQAQVGLIIVEYSYISPTGRSESNQLGIYSNEQIEGLAKLVTVIEASGAQAAIQLTHAGGKSETRFTGGELLGPSTVSVPVKDKMLEIPKEMSLNDIQNLKFDFVQAAIRAEKSGFKIIELHSAHGYGLNQWLSPITNKRMDRYGGTLENRCRLLFEIVAEIKQQRPNLLISVRLPGQDFYPDGLTTQECILIAQQLQVRGVSLINVSSGIGGWRRPESRAGEGYLIDEARDIQKSIDLPVIGVGGIKTKQYINMALAKGWISLAAVGRAILEDPEKWNRT